MKNNNRLLLPELCNTTIDRLREGINPNLNTDRCFMSYSFETYENYNFYNILKAKYALNTYHDSIIHGYGYTGNIQPES